ncbi:MAG: hypothetical protein LBK61_13095, partial [Spirochaetaceae bacterium]|nr:hypothetical protein [Spirochaetaceae bacterium]
MPLGPLRTAPAGGENPQGFHPGPCRGRKPAGFSSRCESFPDAKPVPDANLSPILAEESAAGRQNTVMWRLCFPFGRAMPPHDGILPAGNDAG